MILRLVAAFALVFAGANVAIADEPDDAQIAEAKRFFEAGRQAYESAHYQVAATAFEEAYRLAPRPPVAFSMAQAYRRQFFVDRDPAKLKRAVELYKQYIAEVREGGRVDDASQYVADLEPMLVRIENEQQAKGMGPVEAAAPRRGEATQIMVSSRTPGARARLDAAPAREVPLIRDVAPGKHRLRVEAPGYFAEDVDSVAVDGRLVVVEVNLREQPARLDVRVPDEDGGAGAELALDGRAVATLPLSRPLALPAGRHFLSVTRRGAYPFVREVQLERGQDLRVDAPLPRTRQRVASYWFLGAAGAAILAGGTTTTLTLVHQERAQDILDRRAHGPISPDELAAYQRERAARDDYATATYVIFGGAAALATTGALLYWLDSPTVTLPTGPTLTPAFTPAPGGGAVLGASGTF